MKIYTKTGDDGYTNLIGDRRSKNDIRVEAYGTIDEVNSFVQLATSKMPESLEHVKETFVNISHELFDCAHDLAITKGNRAYKMTIEAVNNLENLIDEYKQQVEDIEYFILPGGCELSSIVHICRTTTRRAERTIVSLKQKEKINDTVLVYVNRLSDYFFIAARLCNKTLGVEDSIYKRSKKVFKGKK